jgi:hypothetical protein
VPPPDTLATVDLAIQATTAYGRPDLRARLEQTRARLLDEHVRVLVVGEFKQGKSQLINALVAAPVCPVDDDVATSVPTVVRHADAPVVRLVRQVKRGSSADGEPQYETDTTEIGIGQLGEHVSEAGNPGNRAGLSYAVVGIPRAVLADGLELVDTPGVGGLGSVHGATTMATLPSADAVLLVSDAAQEYTAPELEFLRQASRVCPNVACVLSKIDLYPEWRRIAELDRAHLVTAGIEAELFPVSSLLRLHALRVDGEDALNAESGFPALVEFLRRRVVGQAGLLSQRSVAQDVTSVAEQLASSMRAELAAQQDPEAARTVIAELEEAQRRASELRERSARWQQTLNDGFADLSADIEYDLRDRIREILRGAEMVIDAGDPHRAWDQLAEWVEQSAAQESSTNFVWASQRANWLASEVAHHFAEQTGELLPVLQSQTSSVLLSQVPVLELPEGERFGFSQGALAGLRGGYIGTLMFGLLGTFAGLALLNPFSAAAGVLLGGKTVREERRRVVQRRQMEAKAAVRRYLDDVQFQVGKDSRDMLRRVQRGLRDHFTERAEEMNRSLKESLRGAEKALKADQAERDQRIADLTAELERIAALERRALALIPAAEPAR